MDIQVPLSSLSLNDLCQQYLQHLIVITKNFGENYKYFSTHFPSQRLGLYDFQQENDLELLELKRITLKHLKLYNSSNNFKCILNPNVCRRLSSIYYYSLGVLLDSNKVEMLRISNIWEKKAFRLSVYLSPILSVHNPNLHAVYAKHGDISNLRFEESSQRNKIISSELKKIEILDIVIQEIDYWKNLNNFWMFLKSGFRKDTKRTSLTLILNNIDLSILICSYLIKKENSYGEINFQQCYNLSIQLFTGFLKSNKDYENDQLALLVRDLGDLKLKKSFPYSWKKNGQDLIYLGRQTGKQGTELLYTRMLAEIENVNSGQL